MTDRERSQRLRLRRNLDRVEQPKREAALEQLRRHAAVLAREFGLPLRSVDAERANVKRRYGVCYEDGSIRIRLFHVRTRRLLEYSSMIDTLCHELAHLRHFNHGRGFEALYRTILERARALGIYRPSPVRASKPTSRSPMRSPFTLTLTASLGEMSVVERSATVRRRGRVARVAEKAPVAKPTQLRLF